MAKIAIICELSKNTHLILQMYMNWYWGKGLHFLSLPYVTNLLRNIPARESPTLLIGSIFLMPSASAASCACSTMPMVSILSIPLKLFCRTAGIILHCPFHNGSLNFHICCHAAFLANITSSFMTFRFIAGSGLIPDTHIILW